MKKIIFLIITAVSTVSIFISCSKKTDDGSRGSSSYTYATTSNVGDYAEWTFDGTTLATTWKEVDGSGGINRTYNINATCDSPNATYGYYTCTINSGSTCTAGLLTCSGSPSGSFEMMESPNTAIFVHTSGGKEQLHVGLVKDVAACMQNVAGDYVYVRTGVGNKDLFGMYRTDANFLNITHADFSMVAASASSTPALTYTTADTAGAGTLTFTDGGCSNGLRTRTASASTLRAMLTNSGLFILDMPAGQGGLVSFSAANAAALSDFEGKTFGGISFPDSGTPSPLNVVFGTNSGAAIPITGDAGGTAFTALDLRALSNTNTATTSPAYPDFSVAPSAGSFSYSANALQSTYAAASAFPGLFRIDGAMSGTGRILLAAAKLNGKVVAFGVVYNYRTTSDTDPQTGGTYASNDLYNTGNFIIFER